MSGIGGSVMNIPPLRDDEIMVHDWPESPHYAACKGCSYCDCFVVRVDKKEAARIKAAHVGIGRGDA